MGIQQCADKRRQQIESSFLNKQEFIQTTSHVLWTVQLTRNISKDDEQHFLRITLQKSISKLHRQFCHTGKNNEGTRGKNDLILENYRKV